MAKKLKCRLITLEEVYETSYQLASKIRESGFQPDVIVAIARGGFPPARFLCDFLYISDLASIKIQHYAPGAEKEEKARVKIPLCAKVKGQKVLIADDVNDTGDSLEEAVKHVKSFDPSEVKTAVLHQKETTDFPADYFAEYIKEWKWLVYPWARVEDVGSFLKEISYSNVEEAKGKLKEAYGLEIADEDLKKVMEML